MHGYSIGILVCCLCLWLHLKQCHQSIYQSLSSIFLCFCYHPILLWDSAVEVTYPVPEGILPLLVIFTYSRAWILFLIITGSSAGILNILINASALLFQVSLVTTVIIYLKILMASIKLYRELKYLFFVACRWLVCVTSSPVIILRKLKSWSGC